MRLRHSGAGGARGFRSVTRLDSRAAAPRGETADGPSRGPSSDGGRPSSILPSAVPSLGFAPGSQAGGGRRPRPVPDPRYIRNFCIVAHIDHGKSTLADRLLEITGTIDARERRDQVLDDMDLERERGITIKASAVAMTYKSRDRLDPKRGTAEYVLHLIDTPGHVDFSYEVQKALQACEGAVLLVDAAQGVEAQTVANANLAMGARLAILPALNKVDLAQARPEEVIEEIEHTLLLERAEVMRVSGKTGAGASELLEAVIDRVPPPKGDPEAPLRALLFDAKFDTYRG